MSLLPTLRLPNFIQPFVVEMDASIVAIGVVFSQQDHSLTFFNKKMCPCLQASSIYIKEMYAIIEAMKK